ncbi:Uncharacterized protein QTN25_008651 [Entamoeba marina]
MNAVVLLLLIAMSYGYPLFGVSVYDREMTEQKAAFIESRLVYLEDVKRHLLDSLDATYEDMFNAGCATPRGQMKKMIKVLRKKIIRVDKAISKTHKMLKRSVMGVNPRARNSIIRHLKIEKRFMTPLF